MAAAAAAVEKILDGYLPRGEGPQARLYEAMRYSTLGGGKRLRPFLALGSADLFGVDRRRALAAAAAVEMVHCYSLVHDDLPAMDDDDMRRGRPTCHVHYDEATAILAGDALLTLAFEVLAGPETHPDPGVRCELVRALAEASGAHGMAGGQMFDLEAERHEFGLDDIVRLQNLKTGQLFRFSCESGAILAGAGTAERQALVDYARDIGLAFQIADDLLDFAGEEAEVGKKVGKDAAAGKATFVSLLGADEAREKARALAASAATSLDIFGEKGEVLSQAARFVVERRA